MAGNIGLDALSKIMNDADREIGKTLVVGIEEGGDESYKEDFTTIDYHTHYDNDGDLVGPAVVPNEFFEQYKGQYPGFKELPELKEKREGMEKANEARRQLEEEISKNPKIIGLLDTIRENNEKKHGPSPYG
jgi:hypothetical protein